MKCHTCAETTAVSQCHKTCFRPLTLDDRGRRRRRRRVELGFRMRVGRGKTVLAIVRKMLTVCHLVVK